MEQKHANCSSLVTKTNYFSITIHRVQSETNLAHRMKARATPLTCTKLQGVGRCRPYARKPVITLASSQIQGAGASGYAVGQGLRPTSPKAWEMISTELRKNKLRFASVSDVRKRNVVVVDIRPKGEYDKGHVPGSVNVEFFQLIQGWDPVRVARRAVYAFFGIMNGTEFNPNFFDDFEKAVAGDKRREIIVYCSIGGSLDPSGPSEFGRQSRSLTAAYELIRAGYKKVSVLDGGMSGWMKSGQDIEMN